MPKARLRCGDESVTVTSGFRATHTHTHPAAEKLKLLTGEAQAGGDGGAQASGESLLWVRGGLAPTESPASGAAEAKPAFAVGSLKLCRLVSQLESWRSALQYRRLYRFRLFYGGEVTGLFLLHVLAAGAGADI